MLKLLHSAIIFKNKSTGALSVADRTVGKRKAPLRFLLAVMQAKGRYKGGLRWLCASRILFVKRAACRPYIFLQGRRKIFYGVFFILQNSDNAHIIRDMQSLGMRFGLERTRTLLDKLGSPDKKLKVIHVSGSNGKGSVCEYLTQILLSAGISTGTFTSPEVFSFEEQYRVNGNCSAALTEKYLGEVNAVADKMEDRPTAFERQTAAAFLYFAVEGCEYAVIECGLGGLTDATNAMSCKVMAVISSVSLEHTAVLGNTLEEIARHKAGIIRGCPAVISRCVPQVVRHIFTDLGARLSDDAEQIEGTEDGTYFTCGGKRFFTAMYGCRQPYNAAAAITAARMLGISERSIEEGVGRAHLAGRLQRIKIGNTIYVLDGAHNPESFIPLVTYLKGKSGARRHIIYGCLSDKDAAKALSMLSDCAEGITAVRPHSYRAMDYDKIVSECRRAFKEVNTAASVGEALDNARGDIVVVCGSFTLLKEAREWTEKRQ